MPTPSYFGTYARFTTPNKSTGADLVGADNMVGDRYQVEFERRGAVDVPWLVSRFGKRVGYVEGAAAEQLLLARAREWRLAAVLASVQYSEQPEPGVYWGEVVLLTWPQSYDDVFEPFAANVCKALANGVRLAVDLGEQGLKQLMESGGAWVPAGREPALPRERGTAIIKDHRTFSEGMIEQARKRNPGCMAAGWAFIALLLAAVVWLVAGFFV